MMLSITVVEEDGGLGTKKVLEVRQVAIKSHRRVTASIVTKILRREFPEVRRLTASKSVEQKGIYHAMHSVEPTKKCGFHYVWRHYYVTAASTQV